MSPNFLTSLVSPSFASRFYARWLAADPGRADQLAQLVVSDLSTVDLQALLQKELDAGLPLPRAMRRLRNLLIVGLIERDLSGKADLAEVVATMTAFADFAIRTHLAALHAEMVELHGVPTGEESGQPQEMIVVGMGKLGGGELNVSSDIDLIFVYPENGDTVAGNPVAGNPVAGNPQQRSLSNQEFFTRLGRKFIAALAEVAEDGFTFRVDMALRPNGNSGPLVASLAMVEQYLLVQGREWERYAWVKARAITGRQDDIAALEAIVRPFVYRRYLDFGAIDAIRNMHAQIRAEVVRVERLHPDRSNNVKLGRGGIREIEFLAQVFQLIRGGRDAGLQDRSTRATLRALAARQLLDEEIVEQLLTSYTFLRNLEHRLQYLEDAQTHTLPANPADCELVAQMMGLPDATTLFDQLAEHRRFVAAQFDAIFGEKQVTPPPEQIIDMQLQGDLSDSDAQETIAGQLQTFGFDDPSAAARRLLSTWHSPRMQSLPEASRNRLAAMMKAALPQIATTAPKGRSATLGRLLDFFEAIARRAAYLSLLTEYPSTLGRVIRMMSASDWAAKYLTQHPILLDELLDDRTLMADPDWPEFARDCRLQLAASEGDTERQMDILREMHHAQLFRLLAQDLEGDLTMERLADHLSALADVIVEVTVEAVWRTIANRHREVPRFAVIAYGKLGGKELGYASDLDVIFLFDDDEPEAPGVYAKLVQRFITWMTSMTSAGILFDVDVALRPDGASGLMVSSVASFERYQQASAWVWEHQALTRARFCAGDAGIGQRFEQIRQNVLRKERDAAVLKQEVLAMRAKMRDANPNRSQLFDLKHDAGGMIDIEFIVQYCVLLHASRFPQLTANVGNIALLKLFGGLGLMNPELALKAGNAYRRFRKLQHQLRLQGIDQARIERDLISNDAAAVQQLWQEVFAEPVKIPA